MNRQDELDIDQTLDKAKMIDSDRKEVDIPEAPAVSNVRVWIKGYGVMFTIRGEKVQDIINKTITLIDYAESHGWKETWNTQETPPQATTSHPTTPQTPSLGACPKCGSPLVEAKKKDGTTYLKCSTNKWDKFKKVATGCDYVDWKN